MIRVIYTRRHSLASLAIRAAAWGGPWSHCGVVDGGEVIECLSLLGVSVTLLDEVQRHSSAYRMVEIPCPDPAAGIAWARSTVGLPYDFSGVLGIPFRQRDWQAPGRWYCSEHVEMTLMKAGAMRFRQGMPGISPTQSYYVRGS